ncbi:MAG: hypothetical protein A2W90_18125 [Bacteroidetes bacterium GWF2_42_66]|nr:MAG: hypothetical protein A2W92_06115 [Bacteroidetes bacterium GWA2_42_15]OFX98170.1 MAG: hypothetical protein A2W89_09615 [Bacteroidetes bacterium GWE2_42_39]OFY42555.1 MAG: hypothetical protein A2W90_18125 [Bacteroidetes bacterium GWF2_42_66]HBL74271.1 hypothetical protein [Prolixibacteraceae bacterium]HCU64040.1 hypothetical protein [Prolixibacteraceae bacterium]
MEFQPYNKKDYLLPDSIHSMAGYHAKLFPNGEYVFRIHDCITGIRLRGELKEEKDFDDAFEKLVKLSQACFEFAMHIEKMKTEIFDKPGKMPPWFKNEGQQAIENKELMTILNEFAYNISNNPAAMNDFIKKVAKMRDLQKQYFKQRDFLTLRACKAAEKNVDQELELLVKKEKQEPKLF